MAGLPSEYSQLMRQAVRDNSSDRPLKRRRKKGLKEPISEQSNDLEVVDLTSRDVTPETPQQPIAIRLDLDQQTPELPHDSEKSVIDAIDAIDAEDDDFDDDDFEDVDLENVKPKSSAVFTEDVVVEFENSTVDQKTKRTRNVIDKEERLFRKTVHRNYIATMMVHGFVRNQWCNDIQIHQHLRKLITTKIYDELHPSKSNKLPQVRTREFLDGLRHLLEKWIKYYKVTSNKGLFKHDWYDWYNIKRSPTPFGRFMKCLVKGRGGRDIGAQGFVALLRAADVPSRLVFSLQPPDFTNMQIKHKANEPGRADAPPSVKDKVIALRKGKAPMQQVDMATQAEIEMKYPVYWAEAWDTVSKVWYTIDPIMFKTIEHVKSKSRLEPPLSHPHNNLTYVIGYDRQGGVRDITKRYAERYYARTRKMRITKIESEDIWYSGFIEALSARPPNRADEYEQEFFSKKAEFEGMPDNVQDFKNHPFYVLERDLRANEILYPRESCGTLRIKGKNDSIPVYKRSCVVNLRSPRAWYQLGRVLKPAQQPLKVRQKTSMQIARNMSFADDDEDKEERLYAEYQTDIYIPSTVVNGLIEKNAFGNIDIFVPSMVPKGAVLIQTPYAEDAAKALEIDYAPAVVGFKFDRRQATPRIEGVVIGEEFKDILPVIQEQIEAEELEKQRIQLEIRALKGWNLMLAKLRIKRRLEKSHGKLDDDLGVDSDEEYDKLQKHYDEYMDNDEDEDEESDAPVKGVIEDGGFLAEDVERQEYPEDEEHEQGSFDADQHHEGFVTESMGAEDAEDGGFLPDEPYHEFIDEGSEVQAGLSIENDIESEGLSVDSGAGFDANDISTSEQVRDSLPLDSRDELDDYEAFMNGLEDVVSDSEMKVTETVYSEQDKDSQSDHYATPEQDYADEVAPTGLENESSLETDDGQQSEKLVPTTEPRREHSKELSQDDEFERKFNEQLVREASGEPQELHIDDDDFEYDSD